MRAIDFDNMSDEEFAKMFEEFDNKMDKFLEQDDFFNRFVAYFIAEEYKQELLPNDSFEVNGKKYFITHGHLMDRYMDVFGDNIVFSGHTHRYNIYGNNINPGSVGLPKVNPEHTCIILEDNIVKLIDLDNFNVIDSRIIED